MTAAKPEQDLEGLWEELTYTASNPIQGRQPFTYPELKDMFMRLVQAEVAAAHKAAKAERMHDFDSIVKAFNLALEADFDHTSVDRLRMVINAADARAKYLELPELHPPQQPPTEGGRK